MLSLQHDDINKFRSRGLPAAVAAGTEKTGTFSKPDMFDAPGGDDKHEGVRTWDASTWDASTWDAICL